MTYTVGTLTFATKGDVRAHASLVLNRAGLGEILTGDDDAFARALLTNHPDAPRKHGVGVDAIVVALIPEWGTRNFLVIREDGSVDNWSIKKCIASLRPDGRSTEGTSMTDITKTHLDELIAAERAKANARIAKLKRDAAAEQRKVDAKVVELLQAQSAELYKRLAKEAKAVLAAEKAERSAKAKRVAEEPAAEPVSTGADAPGHSEEVRQPWNG